MTARLQVGAVLAVVCPWPCSPPRLAFLPARRFFPPDPQPVGPRTPWTLWPPALGLPGGSAPLPAVPLLRLAAPSDRDVSALGPGIAQRPGVRVGTLHGLRPPRVFPRLLSADVLLRHDLADLRSSTTPPWRPPASATLRPLTALLRRTQGWQASPSTPASLDVAFAPSPGALQTPVLPSYSLLLSTTSVRRQHCRT